MKKFICALVLTVLAWTAVPIAQSDSELQDFNLLQFNTRKTDINQDIQTKLTKTVDLTPIPTATPSPTPRPTIVVTPKPQPVIKQLSAAEVKALICKYFTANCNEALTIAYYESAYINQRSKLMNRNGTYDWGIFQINDIQCYRLKRAKGQCGDLLLDIETNIRIAVAIYKEQKWNPWSTKIYLNRG